MKLDQLTNEKCRITDEPNRKSLGEALCDLDDLICEVNKSKCIQEIKRISIIRDENEMDSKKMFIRLNEKNKEASKRLDKHMYDLNPDNSKNDLNCGLSRDGNVNITNLNVNNIINTKEIIDKHELGTTKSKNVMKTEKHTKIIDSDTIVSHPDNEYVAEVPTIPCMKTISLVNKREIVVKNDFNELRGEKYVVKCSSENGFVGREVSDDYYVLESEECEIKDIFEGEPVYRSLSRSSHKEFDNSNHRPKTNSILDDLEDLDDLLQEVNKDKKRNTINAEQRSISKEENSGESSNHLESEKDLTGNLSNPNTLDQFLLDESMETNCHCPRQSMRHSDNDLASSNFENDYLDNEKENEINNQIDNNVRLMKTEDTIDHLKKLDNNLHILNENIEKLSEIEQQNSNVTEEEQCLTPKQSRKFKRNISTEELEELFSGEVEENKIELNDEIIDNSRKISYYGFDTHDSDHDVTRKTKRGGYVEPNINLMLLYERMVSDLNLENCELRRENTKTSFALKRRIEMLQGDIIMLRSDLILKNDFIKHLLDTVKSNGT